MTGEARRLVDRGLLYLTSAQARDGSWGDREGYRGHVAVTALGGLALLAGGHTPRSGPYAGHARKAVEYLLECESREPAGLIQRGDANRQGMMYGHGFGTLFLAECLGAVGDQKLADPTRELCAAGNKTHCRGAERRGRLALRADADAGRCIGHGLPTHGPSGGAKRRHRGPRFGGGERAALRQELPDGRRRLRLFHRPGRIGVRPLGRRAGGDVFVRRIRHAGSAESVELPRRPSTPRSRTAAR